MYYHLNDHLYIAQFRNELILLNTQQDTYSICNPEFAKNLMGIIEHNSVGKKNSSVATSFLNTCPFTQELIDSDIIHLKASPYPYYIDRKISSFGVSNVDWRLPLENLSVSIKGKVLKALLTLIQVNYYIKYKGFYNTICLIKKTQDALHSYSIPSYKELNNLATIINQACLLYPSRTKCLEWAITYVLVALKQGWQCNLEIGVQNYPFLAHAWVECEGKVIMDSQNVREELAVILSEPFRRLKS